MSLPIRTIYGDVPLYMVHLPLNLAPGHTELYLSVFKVVSKTHLTVRQHSYSHNPRMIWKKHLKTSYFQLKLFPVNLLVDQHD